MLVFASQLNYSCGVIQANYEDVLLKYTEALERSADIVVFGRYAISGYIGSTPTLCRDFAKTCIQHVRDLASYVKDVPIIIGGVEQKNNTLVEVVYLLRDGQCNRMLQVSSPLHDLSQEYALVSVGGFNIMITTEESFLSEVKESFPHRHEKVFSHTDVVLLLGKSVTRCIEAVRSSCIMLAGMPCIYLNVLGGYEENVFPGGSFISFDRKVYSFPMWKEECKLIEFDAKTKSFAGIRDTENNVQDPATISSNAGIEKSATEKSVCSNKFTYSTIMLALRDYVRKNGFYGVTLGMSGGIDSALVATLSADALGPDLVHTFMMPTRYTAKMSVEDARECSQLLGVHHTLVEIDEIFSSILESLHKFLKQSANTTEENLQSRIRGMILMAISNSMNLLLLATGNKSELLTGYMTLYGDTCGGFSPLKGVYKTRVYDLVNWRNQNIPDESLCRKVSVIPQRIIDRAPSAELKPNQTDQDTLPEYSVLDHILNLLIDNGLSKEEAVHLGCNRDDVELVSQMVEKASFKLGQVPKGPSI